MYLRRAGFCPDNSDSVHILQLFNIRWQQLIDLFDETRARSELPDTPYQLSVLCTKHPMKYSRGSW